MLKVAQQSETYFNMTAKGQSNDLSTDAVQEAVLADRDDLSSKEQEEINEEKSVDGESKTDIVSEKIELCLQAFDSLDLRDVNLEILPCISVLLIVKEFIECSHYDETKLWLDKIKFRLGGKVSIRHPYQCKIIGNLPKEIFLALGCKMFLITFPSLTKISAMQYHSQGWKLLLHYSLCCQECQKGQSYFKRRVSNGRAKFIVYLEKDCFPLQYQSWSTLDNIP